MSERNAGDASENEASEDYIVIARIARPRGLRGELVADLLSDFPERFDDTTRVALLDAEGRKRREVELEAHWFQKDRVILKFKGFDTIEAAGELVTLDVAVPEVEAVTLDEDEFYEWQLIGCQVETIDKEIIGHVTDVLHTGGVPILVIKTADEKEHLVPLAKTICVEVDIAEKLIRVDAPENLLEL